MKGDGEEPDGRGFKEEFSSLAVSPLKNDNPHAMHEVGGGLSCWVEALSLGSVLTV